MPNYKKIVTPEQFSNLKITKSVKQNFVLLTNNNEVLQAYDNMVNSRYNGIIVLSKF